MVVFTIIIIKQKKCCLKETNKTDPSNRKNSLTIEDGHTRNASSSSLISNSRYVDPIIHNFHENENSKIIFNENNIQTEIKISQGKTMRELIDMYYKNNRSQNNGRKIFIHNNQNILSEENRNKKIKEYLKDENDLNISVFEMEKIKKINYKEDGYLTLKLYLSNDKKVSDLIDMYYKKKKIKNEDKKNFLCGGDIINHENNKEIGDILKDVFAFEVLVINK